MNLQLSEINFSILNLQLKFLQFKKNRITSTDQISLYMLLMYKKKLATFRQQLGNKIICLIPVLISNWLLKNNTIYIFFRFIPIGGYCFWPNNPNFNPWLPSVFRCGFPNSPGSTRYRPRGRNGLQHSRASGSSGIPARRTHQENQSWTTGKSLQTQKRCRGWKAPEDYSESCIEKETVVFDLVNAKSSDWNLLSKS